MLLRKMLREMKENFGQFLSIFLLAFVAMLGFCSMAGHVFAENHAREKFHEACNLSELWLYGENFTTENLEDVLKLDFIQDAGLRMSVTGSAPDYKDAQVDLYLEREDVVNKPYLIEGEEFDPSDTEGIWLTNAFAEAWDIQVGDPFTIHYNGIEFTKKVKGLIESAEYEYRQADGDADVYVNHIAFVYLSYDAFPIREYIEHMIENEKITAENISENSDLMDSNLANLEKQGISVDNITQDMLLQMVDKMGEDQLAQMMPFTQMVIKTKDGSSLEREDEIAEAIDDNYAVMVDRSSIMGLARLDSEVEQHESFSYLFVIIFIGIAILVIATSMSRMVERQRTQIGTMNALGMKRYKIIFHYVGYSFFVTLLGVVAGLLIGVKGIAPLMIGIFAEWYIVPGLSAIFDICYVWVGAAVVVICVLSAYISCRKALKIKPAEALRPAPPKSGKRCIFERLPIWNRFSFNVQYNLRDISRSKLRAVMGIVGTAAGMLLMVYGVACNSLVDSMETMTFDKVQKADYLMNISEDAKLSELDEIADDTDGELVMMGQIEVSASKNALSTDKRKETVTVTEGKGKYNILDLSDKVTSIPKGEMGVSRKLAEDLGLSVGDICFWHIYEENTWHKAKIGFIYHSSETQGIAYLREDFEETGAKFTPTVLYSDQNLSEYQNKTYVRGVNDRAAMKKAFEKSMEIVNIMVWAMIIFSIILIVVVLYNSGNLSFHERVKEFATLKVLGLQSGQIRRILTLQNIWLSVIGICAGAPCGNATFNVMMNTNGANYDYNLKIDALSYIVSGVLVLVFSMAVSFLFSKRIKRLEMVEVLKGAE